MNQKGTKLYEYLDYDLVKKCKKEDFDEALKSRSAKVK